MDSTTWTVQIKTLNAEIYRNLTSQNAYDVMVTLDGSAEMDLDFTTASQLCSQRYTGFYKTRSLIKNELNSDGGFHVLDIKVLEIGRFVLRVESGCTTTNAPPDAAFSVTRLDSVILHQVQAYVTKHYANRDLLDLLPGFDIQRWIDYQQDRASQRSWLTDLLNGKADQDEADWWKRGENPPC